MVNLISYRNVPSCRRAPRSYHIEPRPRTLEKATFNLTVEKETKMKALPLNQNADEM